ncbi:vWA domain-containing protein [Streptomyces resistomycificus]|uniref:vWA domain-containing protein n=1 Tax=Streptomyces resistomycificus TaxID=67356 RepID=UPI0004AAFFB8|nr:von Willebrand factor type A domain-containing protein [Streptomyces resistomycificus]
MERHRIRRLRAALVALTATGGLLLTGCGASGDSDRGSSSDRADGATGFPAPGPDRGTGEQDGDSPDDESREVAPSPDHLSTFALDVDTASYGYARRTLADGQRPDPSTIRPEEFVNSFRQDYERPDGNGFSVTVDGARTDDEDWSLVRVGLATRGTSQRPDDRPPAALTFVIDISGSMAEPGRLDLAQESLGVMTDRLRDDDSVAIVTFSDQAKTVLPMTRLGGNRDEIHDAVDDLEPTFSTNLGAGVETGYATAVEGRREGATNRVVLVSDALANDGDTDADSILERIDGARREHGITLFGVGVGSDYGDALMERLADKGDGHTVYVSGADDAEKVFCEQLPRNIDLTARDAKAQVAFDPETCLLYTVTALYAVRTRQGADGHLATATVRWQDPETRTPHEESGQLESDSLDHSVWSASPRFQVTAVAAYFADALRRGDDRWAALPDARPLDELAGRADDLADTTEDRAVRELADTIRRARHLAD